MLGFLEKYTLRPAEIVPEDMQNLLVIGISEQAIQDALYVGAIFQIMNRLADSFDVAVPPPAVFALSAKSRLERGYYRAPS
ncbi:hypothetical protein KDK_48470 [Dictyobacter kobayashii]|uniref:Uncharacterized protein n=2 Tax=Dictyobacter kobayashii TaxID=2014872 RepID=A0A402APK6_9CHLR|nr:hypothetical protein KDK_48470 [Dictyobacter kobayashii]